MWRLSLLLFLLSSALRGELLDELATQLLSDEFVERQTAEEKIIAWVEEADSEARAESLFQRYLDSKEPEEFHRLAKLLAIVHFDYKRDEIPQTGSGFIGIRMSQLNHGEGVVVEEIIAKTPAAKAGIQPFDMITAIDGESIAGGIPRMKLQTIVGGRPPGTKLTLSIIRGEDELELEVQLMNAGAVPAQRFANGASEVDEEKLNELLRADYLRWLNRQRATKRAQEQSGDS